MADKETDCCNNLKLRAGPGPLRPLKLQDVIERLEDKIFALEAENVAVRKELAKMTKKDRELEANLRRLGRV
jgi:hypothetical protein